MPIIACFPVDRDNGSGLPVSAVSNVTTLSASEKVYIKWTDPEDIIIESVTLATWDGTILVRKAGSMPTSRRDGVVILDSKTRNAYKNSYFCDSGLSNGTTYYYKFYPYTKSNTYTDDVANEFTVVPNPVTVGNVSGISAVSNGNGKLAIKWTDPAATVVSDGVTLATWASTKVVYKTGSYPTSPEDGTLAVNSTTHNAYFSTALNITGLTNGTTYYIAFFPTSIDGAININTENRTTGVPNRFVISTVPSQSGTLTYTGGTLTPTWSNYDSTKMTIGGTTSTVNAGTFAATFTPKDDYCWSDGSTTAKSVNWTVGKATGSLSINPTSLTLNNSATTGTITVTRAGDGAISAVSSDTSVATVSVSGTTVSVNNVNQTSGSATITISVAAGTNHTAPSNMTCAVTADFLPAKDTLENTSWEDIATISKAGRAAEYWSIGDQKTITLNGVSYVVDIIGFDHDTPTDTAAYGRSKAGITFQLHDLYATTYQMIYAKYNDRGWEACDIRVNIMPALLNQMSSDLSSVIIPVDKLWGGNNYSYTLNTISDSLFLLSETEVCNSNYFSAGVEGTQYAYYAAGNSIIKKLNGSAADWWFRSQHPGQYACFGCVVSNGQISSSLCNNYYGISFGFSV